MLHTLIVEESVWRPSRAQWVAPDGTVWRRRERWLSERDAHRFVRAAAVVAVEQAGTHELTWLASDDKVSYWQTHVAGHVDSVDGLAPANEVGLTYHVSTWRSAVGQRLVLLSESC